jgi:site-specific recombinase XerC
MFSRLRFRALVEVLLGTGARISEVLSLDRSDVNLDHREAKIIGKGNKQRTLFFTERSLEWLGRYLSRRRDVMGCWHRVSLGFRGDVWGTVFEGFLVESRVIMGQSQSGEGNL